MNCPACGSELAPACVQGITAQRCSKCPGLWLELSELDRAAAETVGLEPMGDPSPLPCPRCGSKLATALFPGGIPVEGCLKDRGVFLRSGDDPGTLDTFLGYPERLKASKRKAKAADGMGIVRDMFKGLLDFFR